MSATYGQSTRNFLAPTLFVSEQIANVAHYLRIQMTLIQNQLNVWIYRLGISRPQAWMMIREKLESFFQRRQHQENAKRLRDYLFAEEVPHKAFMKMRFSKAWRVYDYSTVPNVLLEGSESLEEKKLCHENRSNGTGV